jgi:PPIC-type PPIASE domain
VKLDRIIREPLVHFFVLGAALFGLFAWLHKGALDAPDEIVVDGMRVDALRMQYERLWQRPPTGTELKGLVGNWIREEILYREGLALGLDRDDPVLRRRIAQKMSFMADQADPPAPTDAELQAWLDAHPDDYRIEPTYSFRQVYFDPDRHAGPLDDAIGEVRSALARGADAGEAGDSTMLPRAMSRASVTEVRRNFGDDFADALADVVPGSWAGPLPSAYGVHLVYVEGATPARAATLAEVRAAVERDVGAAQRKRADDAFYESLRERYTVRYDDDVSFAAGGPAQGAAP